ncbi:MAG: nicotinate (nicotinamide) nucleotide adenylyltransferase [candidate division Zixibacteria bacterium]|nr:nicotinate (nicotinamide) nucleotide adenylyltransferase [candidate division Zixibacteria bacterium]
MPTPENGGDWGILGGSFDPIHRGHLNLASRIRSQKNLSGVFMIPSFRHPFKNACHASFEDRVEMLRLAIAGNDHFIISEIEKEINLPGYTLSTIRALKKKYPQVSFFFIMGQDNLIELNRWHKPDEILSETKILVGCRPPHDPNTISGFPADRIELVETTTMNASSTQIRELLRSNVPPEKLNTMIPDAVREYILTRGLYQ